jgi:hypothetical protein
LNCSISQEIRKVEVVYFEIGLNKSELERRRSKSASACQLQLCQFDFLRRFAEYVDVRIDCDTASASNAGSGLCEIFDLALHQIKL